MREVIATGKTVEEATQNACAQLGLAREEVSIQILEMPVKKLFRSIPAKVKAVAIGDEIEEEAPAAAPAVQEQPAPAKPEPKPQPVEPVQEAPAESEPEEEVKEEEPQPAALSAEKQQKVDVAVAYLSDIFAKMGVEGTVITPQQQGEATVLRVEGEKAGTLIGRRGETMEALSYLASLVANRAGGDYLKLGLDVAGYRSKRESDLAALARRIAARALKTGRSQELEPMNPYERRIIHSAVSAVEGVHSESRGEGADRRVVIYPDNPAPRAPRKGGRGGRPGQNRGRGGRGPRAPRTPEREFADKPRTSEGPTAPRRTESINDAEGFALYGKIEL